MSMEDREQWARDFIKLIEDVIETVATGLSEEKLKFQQKGTLARNMTICSVEHFRVPILGSIRYHGKWEWVHAENRLVASLFIGLFDLHLWRSTAFPNTRGKTP